jgi:hypothetical protein
MAQGVGVTCLAVPPCDVREYGNNVDRDAIQ